MPNIHGIQQGSHNTQLTYQKVRQLIDIANTLSPEVQARLAVIIATLDDTMLEKLTFLTRVMEYDPEYNAVRFKHGISFDYNVNITENLGLQSNMPSIKAGAVRVTRRQGRVTDTLYARQWYTIHALPCSPQTVRPGVRIVDAFLVEPTQEEFNAWINSGTIEVIDESESPSLLPPQGMWIPFQQVATVFFYYRLRGTYEHPTTHEVLTNPYIFVTRGENFQEMPVRIGYEDITNSILCEMVYIIESEQEYNSIFKWQGNDLYILGEDNLTYYKITPSPVTEEEHPVIEEVQGAIRIMPTEEVVEVKKKSFWQKIKEFFKKIFKKR